MRLGTDASLTEIMSKMESVFGNVDELETIMSDFYNAKQKETEDVSAWSCRLEGILDKAIHSGKVSKPQADTMMHDMLWKGLRPDIKHISHYEKERFKTFDHLRVALRKIEKEHNLDELPKVKATSKQAIANDMNEKEEESELVTTLKQINTRLEQLESTQHNKQQFKDQPNQQQQDTQPQPYQETFNQFRGRGYNRGGRGNRGYDRGYGRGYGRGNGRAFGLVKDKDRKPHTKYIQELKNRLVDAYKLASESAKKANEKQKEHYDLKVRGAVVEKGDKVLVKKVAFDGKHKLSDKWENDIYLVLSQPNKDIPVYVVQKDSGEGRKRTLHRNLLLPVGYISSQPPTAEPLPRPVPRPRTRLQKKISSNTDCTMEDTDIESDDDYEIFVHQRPMVDNTSSSVDDDETDSLDDHEEEVLHTPESDGDAHDIDIEVQELDSLHEDEEQESSLEPETLDPAHDDDIPPVVPRRSGRERTQPKWLQSGDFVTKSAVPPIDTPVLPPAEWRQKADYLSSCIARGLFSGIELEAGKALLAILTDH
ncbi:Hypothetical predicted protein [Mytilus galloprovincialis]|uniref:Paraneoplastic antigen Ma-like C-terminal domain-containing protein n=1 Tax=Mytilus galloprovincialis TaxID=29158 RepID=A0A8B6BJP1_MYTGA|nr:Hypothetical predicted protein [Mytilus galloprovincialis]